MSNDKSMSKSFFIYVSVFLFVCFFNTDTMSGQNSYTKLCLEAISFEESGRLDEAVESYRKAINLKPGEWTGYNYRARVNFHRGRYDDAINDLSKAVTLSPQNLSLYALRASCYEGKGLFDRAIEDYNMALSKPEKNAAGLYMTYYQRGRTYFSKKKFQESVSDFSKAIELAKKDGVSTPEIFEKRAEAYIELKRYPEALADLDVLLSSNPDDIKILLLQGHAFLKNGDKEKAKALAVKIIQFDPAKGIYFSGDRMQDIFDLDMRMEKSVQLTELAGELIKEQSTVPSKILAAMKLTDAFTYLDTAWIYNPGLTEDDRNIRGTIMEDFFKVYPLMKTKPEISEQVRKYAVQASGATQDKNYGEAIKLWSVTLDMAPYYPLAYYNRALLYERAGQFKNSIADMERYIQLVPEASDARSSRDKIYEWEGKIKDMPGVVDIAQTGAINRIESKSYSPGNFRFAVAMGGSFGLQIAKNPGLEDLWLQCTQGATPEHCYSDKMPFLFSGDVELTVRPVKRLGIGAFGKYAGGIGTRTSVSEVKYIMDMGTLIYGGFVRGYLLVNDGAARPDLYLQYAIGKSQLTGYYGVATMDGIIFDYSYMKRFEGSDILHSAGLGMGGRIGKHGYLTLSADYLLSEIKAINYEVTTDKNNPGNVGNEGVVINTLSDSNTTAKYNGVVIKLLFGICF